MIGKIIRLIAGFFRANFFAGLFIATPFGATILLLIFLWGKLQEPVKKFCEQVFDIASGPEDTPWASIFSAVESSNYSKLLVPLIGLLIILGALLFLGIITRSIMGRMALRGVEKIVSHVPVVGMLYMSLKQLGVAFITPEGHSKFERAVAVQFPYRGCWAIGFVTGKAIGILHQTAQPNGDAKKGLLTVFVPSTPLPTNGFMIVVPEEETRPLDMSVQDALKLVVSGGIINPGESRRAPNESQVSKIVRREVVEKLKLGAGSEKGEG